MLVFLNGGYGYSVRRIVEILVFLFCFVLLVISFKFFFTERHFNLNKAVCACQAFYYLMRLLLYIPEDFRFSRALE